MANLIAAPTSSFAWSTQLWQGGGYLDVVYLTKPGSLFFALLSQLDQIGRNYEPQVFSSSDAITWSLIGASAPPTTELILYSPYYDGTIVSTLFSTDSNHLNLAVSDFNFSTHIWSASYANLVLSAVPPNEDFVGCFTRRPDGSLFVSYDKFDGTGVYRVFRSGSWSAEVVLPSATSGRGNIQADSSSNVHLVVFGSGGAADYYQISSADVVTTGPINLISPQVAAGNRGNLVVGTSIRIILLDVTTSQGKLFTGSPVGTPTFTSEVITGMDLNYDGSIWLVPTPTQNHILSFQQGPFRASPQTSAETFVASQSLSSLPDQIVYAVNNATSTPTIDRFTKTSGVWSGPTVVYTAPDTFFLAAISTFVASIFSADCASPPTGTVGTAYTHTFTSSGGTAPITWAVVVGTLPPGLTLNTATGVVTGTPTTPGTYPFTLRATDVNGLVATVACSITILSSLSGSCNSLPGGTVGVAYSHSVTATGGTPPYTFAITAGALPPGLTMSTAGLISGTPTTPGMYSFTITITDSVGATFEFDCSINIPPVPSAMGRIRTWLRGTRPGNDRGWSLDAYEINGPISRASELTATVDQPLVGVSDKLLGIGGGLYQFEGDNDAGSAIPFAIETRLDDVGEARAIKLWGDATLEVVTNKDVMATTDLALTLLGDPIAGSQATGFTGFVGIPIPNTGGGKIFQIYSPNSFNRTLGIRITGRPLDYAPEFYSWQPAWVVKPETTAARIDDWSDDGKASNKLVRGCVIEGDTAFGSGTDLATGGLLTQVTSAFRPFSASDVGGHLVLQSGTNWIPDIYVVLSVTGVTATLDHAIATMAATGGVFAIGLPKSLQVQSDGGAIQTTIVVSHPGQTESPYFWAPFETHEMRMAPTDATNWREFKIRWIYDDYPEYGAQIEDFVHLTHPLYCRGFELEASTKGQPIPFQFQADLGVVLATPTINTAVRDILAFGFPMPQVISEYRVVPLGSWEKFGLRLIGEEYPDFAALTTAHLYPAKGRPAHIRGFSLRASTLPAFGTASPANIRMFGDGALLQTFVVNQPLIEQIPVPYVMGIPKTVKMVQFVPATPADQWRFWEAIWDAEEYPELTTEWTKVIDLGGCRLVQGARIPADSQGASVQYQVYGDQETLQLTTSPASWQGKVTIAFPRANEWVPFFAHEVFLIPLAPIRTFTDQIEWISEPAPDIATGYITPPITLEATNWWTERWAWFAYISTAPVTLTVALDGGTPTETYIFPSSAGKYARNLLPLLPSKAKSRVYSASSTAPFRLYKQDSFISCKPWGGAQFSPLHIFGDRSLDSGARI